MISVGDTGETPKQMNYWNGNEWVQATINSPKHFITKCAKCGTEIRLLKDSTEGKKVYCGGCYEKDYIS